MVSYEEQKQMVETAIKLFPETFGLRAFKGEVFRISKTHSYVSDIVGRNKVILYTDVQGVDGEWRSFAKGTIVELMADLVRLP